VAGTDEPQARREQLPIGLMLITGVLLMTGWSTCSPNMKPRLPASSSALSSLDCSPGPNTGKRSRGTANRATRPVPGGDGSRSRPRRSEGKPGNILVAVRDPRNLSFLRNVLHKTDTTKQEIVVMTARLYHREHSFSGSAALTPAKSSIITSRNCSPAWSLWRAREAACFPAGCPGERCV